MNKTGRQSKKKLRDRMSPKKAVKKRNGPGTFAHDQFADPTLASFLRRARWASYPRFHLQNIL